MEPISLKCKFRGSFGQSGVNIYFCCHDEDFSRYFEALSEDILDQAPDAVIWYRDPDTPPAGNHYDLLNEMSLFLVPVTTRFVYSDCDARLSELPFAEDRRLPVLPVLLENGLAEEFNRRCGNMHLLNRIPGDPLAPPYAQALNKYLTRIVVGDDLTARIRQAFRGSIFLSYRKIDLQHARRVMRLIHDIDLCRDTAIWYDAFLTPGENFHSGIQEAMQKSSLCAMVITPSMMQMGNYVMEKEYPAAVGYGMPIVPIEAVPTDRLALADCYPGIPAPISTDDSAELRRALAACLPDEIPEQDPMRDYLIGLAYLRGIDMETDPQRALKLITAAAQAGLPEACGQLVNMYSIGDGVPRDERTAAVWQQNYVNLLKQSCDGSREQLMELHHQTETLWNFLNDSRESEAAAQTSRELVMIARSLLEMGCPEGHRAMAASLKCEISEAERLGDFREAERLARDAVDAEKEYLRGMHGQQIDSQFPVEHWNAIAKLGSILEYRGNYPEAEAVYHEALKYADHLIHIAPILKNRLLFARSFIQLADLYMHSHRPCEAEETFHRAAKLLEEEGKDSCIHTKATIFARLGEIYRVQCRFEEAEAVLEEAAELLKAMEQNPSAKLDLHHVYQNMYDLYIASNDFAKAGSLCRRALELDESLEGFIGSAHIRYLRCGDLINLGTLCLLEKHYPQSIPHFRQAEELCRESDRDSFSVRLNQAQALLGLATAARFTGDQRTALNYYREGTRILEDLPDESILPLVQKQRAEAHGWLGQQLFTAGKLPEAAEQLRKAIALKEQFLTETDNADYHRSLGRDQLFLGQVYLRQGRGEDALTVCRQGLEQLTRAYDLFRKPEAAQDLTMGLRQTAELYQKLGKFEDAIRAHLRGAEIAAEAKLPAAGPMQAVSHYDIACLYMKLGQYAQMQNHLTSALRFLTPQVCANPQLRQLRDGILRMLAASGGTPGGTAHSPQNAGNMLKNSEKSDILSKNSSLRSTKL